jgi:hypothetical protein
MHGSVFWFVQIYILRGPKGEFGHRLIVNI